MLEMIDACCDADLFALKIVSVFEANLLSDFTKFIDVLCPHDEHDVPRALGADDPTNAFVFSCPIDDFLFFFWVDVLESDEETAEHEPEF